MAKRQETITINATTCSGLKGQKGEVLTAVFKFEYGDKVLGESAKIEFPPDSTEPVAVNFTTTLPVNCEDPVVLDDLLHKIIVVTLHEVLPKEKKQKDEKVVTLGQTVFSLATFMEKDVKEKNLNLLFYPYPGSSWDHSKAEENKVELKVLLSTVEPIMTPKFYDKTNTLRIRLGSAFSLPEAFTVTGPPYQYIASTSVPHHGEKTTTLVFSGGAIKPPVSTEKEAIDKRIKWYSPGKAVSNGVFIPGLTMAKPSTTEDEDGVLKAKEDQDFRKHSEQDRNRVVWNIERTCFLEANAQKRMMDKIADSKYWPVEVFRLFSGSPQKGGPGGKLAPKAKEEEEGIIYHHGVAYVDMSTLLYPGKKRIYGVFKIEGYNENEVLEKTRFKQGTSAEAVRTVLGNQHRSDSPRNQRPTIEKGAKALGENLKKPKSQAEDARKSAVGVGGRESINPAAMVNHSTSQGSSGPTTANVEGQAYNDAKSFVYIEIELARPLIEERTTYEQVRKIHEIIPAKPLFQKYVCGADKAVADYHNQVKEISKQILGEFRAIFGAELEEITRAGQNPDDLSPDEVAKRKQRLVYELNTSGKYHAFKEQLKYSITKIVREKFLCKTPFRNEQELIDSMSHFYVFFVDEMHVALNEFLAVNDQKVAPARQPESSQLKQFADEAEKLGDFELADKYHQERIAFDKKESMHWVDYGRYLLCRGDLVKAEECFQEAVSLEPTSEDALIMTGIVCVLQGHHTTAKVCLETAITVAPNSVVAWTIISMFYSYLDEDMNFTMALAQAEKLFAENVAAAAGGSADHQKGSANGERVTPGTGSSPRIIKGVEDQRDSSDTATQEAVKKASANAAASRGTVGGAGLLSASGTWSTSVNSLPPKHRQSILTFHSLAKKISNVSVFESEKSSGTAAATGRRTSMAASVKSKAPVFGAGGANTLPTESSASTLTPQFAVLSDGTLDTIYMRAAEYLIANRFVLWAEKALGLHLLHPRQAESSNKHSVVYTTALARCSFIKGDLDTAEMHVREVLKYDYKNSNMWALMGHVLFKQNNFEGAVDHFDRSLGFQELPDNLRDIYLSLGTISMRAEQYEKAKNMFMLATQRFQSSVSWKGVGAACYRLDQFANSEEALCEANLLNPYDAEVWAYLSLVCLNTKRVLEAEQSFKFAMKLGLKDQSLIDELHHVQQIVGFGNPDMMQQQRLQEIPNSQSI